MINIQIQPHADGIGGHQKIDIAVLIQFHLCIAGARGQRPHHHRRAAPLAADQFGDGIHIFDREPHDGAARLHPADLFRSCIGQL